MDTEPDITITQHAVQDKPLTPGITPDYMKQQGHQGHPAAALSSGSLSDGWSGCTHAYVHEGICVHGPWIASKLQTQNTVFVGRS